jgi:hypothetical protein
MTGWADDAEAGRSSGVTGTDDDDADGAPNNLNKL